MIIVEKEIKKCSHKSLYTNALYAPSSLRLIAKYTFSRFTGMVIAIASPIPGSPPDPRFSDSQTLFLPIYDRYIIHYYRIKYNSLSIPYTGTQFAVYQILFQVAR